MSVRSRRTFQELVTLPDGAVPLAEAALLMACEEYPQLQISPYLDQLDEIAAAARQRVSVRSEPADVIRIINDVLFDQFGFRGNEDNYYDPRNSFFNDVIDRRLGIPITLSTVYLEIARRLDFPMVGVGLPGHFIVKYANPHHELFLDPYNGGAILTVDDCRQKLKDHYGDALEFSDRMLARVTHKQILTRMLNNLKKIYVESQSFDKGLAVVDMMIMVEPADLEQVRDRGLIRVQLRQFEAAAKDLERYLKSASDAEDRRKVAEQLKSLRQIQAMMN
jgi:regulator of sirC expression with transglutaminase-like and TPR domain